MVAPAGTSFPWRLPKSSESSSSADQDYMDYSSPTAYSSPPPSSPTAVPDAEFNTALTGGTRDQRIAISVCDDQIILFVGAFLPPMESAAHKHRRYHARSTS